MKRHASLNRMYRLVWSRVQNAWIAVSEITKGQGKSGRSKTALKRKAIVAALALAFTPLAHANPIGAQVVSGTASITQSGNLLTITNSPNAILNWQSFSIGSNETTSFIQQSASSSVLNRVVTNNPSSLLGSLISNGKVYLVNPAGILVGAGAKIDVAGLVATTLNISNADFLNGNLNFTSTPNAGAVSNSGTITTPDGGSVYLVAPQVENSGIIITPKGETILAAGNTVTLMDTATPGVSVQVTGSATTATNLGQIIADTGRIGVVGAVVNNSGTLNANSIVSQGGRVFLQASQSITAGGTISAEGIGGGSVEVLADMQQGSVNVAGTLDASAPNGGNGGFIETSASSVNIANTAKVTTAAAKGLYGNWLIDPTDFTIAASGGDITGAALSSALTGGNITIQSSTGASGTAGNVNVNDTVSWSANKLTLNAYNDININSTMNGSGTASLELQYGQGASNGVINGVTANYYLNNDAAINLPAGQNFSTQLGSSGTTANYTVITSLGAAADATTAPSTMSLQGMAASSSLSGNYVLGANIVATATSSWNSGAGFTPIGNSTSQFTGIFDGLGHTISNLAINLPSINNVGLFGFTGTAAVIRHVGLAGGSVSGSINVGGLVGYNNAGISNSYATGSVEGALSVGGLVGYNNAGTISNSYASVGVNGAVVAGGLVGTNSGSISNSYATGSVSGASTVGGLAGENIGSISNSYAAGSVTSTGSAVGGLAGTNTGTISNSYWNISTSGQSTSAGGLGLTSAQMMQLSSFTGWNISATGGSGDVWRIYEGHTAPLLASFMTPLTLADAPDVTVTYDGSSHAGGGTTSILGVMGSAAPTETNAGIYNGYYSTQQGYDITGGNLIINPAPLTVTGLSGTNQTYNGTTVDALTGTAVLHGLIGGQTLTLGNTTDGTLASANAGSELLTAAITLANGTNGGLASNYSLIQPTMSVTIAQAPITVGGTSTVGNKVYDGTTAATLTGGILSGTVYGSDNVTLTQSGNFATKNVGTGIPVTATDSLGGTSAGNYYIPPSGQPTGLTANITPLTLTLSTANASMAYNGTTIGEATFSDTGIISGDAVNIIDTAIFVSKNAAAKVAVLIAGINLTGTDAGNYALNATSLIGQGRITPKPITVTATSGNMVYDGKTKDTAAITLSSSGIISGDVLRFYDTSATFSDKNVGNGITVTVTGIRDRGADSEDYTIIDTTTTTTANITPKPITVKAKGTNMVYDGSVNDIVTLSAKGLIAGDALTFTDTSATFATKDVGTGKIVTVAGITASGTNAEDYTYNTTATTKANITLLKITVTADVTITGTVISSVVLGSTGILPGDVSGVGFTYDSATDENSTVTVKGIAITGTDATDYKLSSTTVTTTASITP